MEIFIDETGDNGLDFSEGKSEPWFIITAIIVESEDLNNLENELNRLADQLFNGAEIKSKRLKKPEIRLQFINDISELKWRGYILQVDKTKLLNTGYEWKKTFYKNLPEKVYDYLIAIHQSANIHPDPVGDVDFQFSLKEYVIKKNPLDLFDQNNFDFISAKNNRITQLADFCSGTLFRDLRDNTNYFNKLSSKFFVRIWPRSFEYEPEVETPIKDIIDQIR